MLKKYNTFKIVLDPDKKIVLDRVYISHSFEILEALFAGRNLEECGGICESMNSDFQP